MKTILAIIGLLVAIVVGYLVWVYFHPTAETLTKVWKVAGATDAEIADLLSRNVASRDLTAARTLLAAAKLQETAEQKKANDLIAKNNLADITTQPAGDAIDQQVAALTENKLAIARLQSIWRAASATDAEIKDWTARGYTSVDVDACRKQVVADKKNAKMKQNQTIVAAQLNPVVAINNVGKKLNIW